jgi:hypothetical protein
VVFTSYDCNNQSNKVELYSLLEPDTCLASDRSKETETTFIWSSSADEATRCRIILVQASSGQNHHVVVLWAQVIGSITRYTPVPGAQRALRVHTGET